MIYLKGNHFGKRTAWSLLYIFFDLCLFKHFSIANHSTYVFKKALALFCIMFLCIALSQLGSDSLLSWVACQGRGKNASLGPSINDVTIFPLSFWPFPPPRYPFCIIYFPSIFDNLPHIKMKTSIIFGPFIVEPATFMHPSKFERKKWQILFSSLMIEVG